MASLKESILSDIFTPTFMYLSSIWMTFHMEGINKCWKNFHLQSFPLSDIKYTWKYSQIIGKYVCTLCNSLRKQTPPKYDSCLGSYLLSFHSNSSMGGLQYFFNTSKTKLVLFLHWSDLEFPPVTINSCLRNEVPLFNFILFLSNVCGNKNSFLSSSETLFIARGLENPWLNVGCCKRLNLSALLCLYKSQI